jgi:hypothetical protein
MLNKLYNRHRIQNIYNITYEAIVGKMAGFIKFTKTYGENTTKHSHDI